MNFSFKKFIPKAMQDTKWGSLTEVWQSIYTDIKTNKVNSIFDQYDFDNATEQELRDLAIMFGFNLKTLEGYTSTLDFIKKEMLYIIPRIQTKTTYNCYKYQGVPFNLVSTGYSVIWDGVINKYRVDETLLGDATIGTITLDREDQGATYIISDLNFDGNLILDNSLVMDTMSVVLLGDYDILTPSYLDFIEFPSLDGGTLIYSLTRNMVFNYKFKCVESPTEFLSPLTLKVLKSDIDQFKRVTDRCYYEPYILIDLNENHTVTNKTWTDYQGLNPTVQKSIFIGSGLSSVDSIRLGSGTHTVIDNSITDVQLFSQQFSYTSGVHKIINESGHINFRTYMDEQQYFSGFTEVALLDGSGNCILYSTFPKVQWDTSTYSNIKFDFNII